MNARFERDFKKYLEEEKNATTYSAYSNNGYGGMYASSGSTGYYSKDSVYIPNREYLVRLNDNRDNFEECGELPDSYIDKCNVFFYEFSSTEKGCKHFNSLKSFISWAEKCGITITPTFKREISYGNTMFAVCLPNSSTAYAKNSVKNLERFLNKYPNGGEVDSADLQVWGPY